MNRFTRGIAMTSARHPWRTIASWIFLMGGIFFLAGAAGGTFTEDFSAPDSQSARAVDLLDENFPEAAKATALVVFAAEDGETLEEHSADIAAVLPTSPRSSTSSRWPTRSRPAPSRRTAGSATPCSPSTHPCGRSTSPR